MERRLESLNWLQSVLIHVLLCSLWYRLRALGDGGKSYFCSPHKHLSAASIPFFCRRTQFIPSLSSIHPPSWPLSQNLAQITVAMPQQLGSKEASLFRQVVRHYENRQYKKGMVFFFFFFFSTPKGGTERTDLPFKKKKKKNSKTKKEKLLAKFLYPLS